MKLELRGTYLTGSIRSTIDDQSAFFGRRIVGGAGQSPLVCWSDKFRLHLSYGHPCGHAFGKHRSERAGLDLEPAPALLPHAELAAEIPDVDRQTLFYKKATLRHPAKSLVDYAPRNENFVLVGLVKQRS
jgi:hypothetical protein